LLDPLTNPHTSTRPTHLDLPTFPTRRSSDLLRRTKLTVLDEVANGLSFYDYTFLHEVPRLHCALEDRLNQEEGGTPGELASFLKIGKHTSELQSPDHLVCRLLLEKKTLESCL